MIVIKTLFSFFYFWFSNSFSKVLKETIYAISSESNEHLKRLYGTKEEPVVKYNKIIFVNFPANGLQLLGKDVLHVGENDQSYRSNTIRQTFICANHNSKFGYLLEI